MLWADGKNALEEGGKGVSGAGIRCIIADREHMCPKDYEKIALKDIKA
jgi:hypothetical protein